MIECRAVRFPDNASILTSKVRDSLIAQRYEGKEATEVEKLLKEGDRVLELGAGLGFISTICARDSRTASVLSYEADPRLVTYIRDVHALNGVTKADVRHGALATDLSRGEMPFFVRHDFWGSSFSEKGGPHVSTVSVPVLSFNAVVENFRPTFIVCDIEGAEGALFEHATLHGVTRVLLEIHSRIIGRSGVKALFDAMSARGFHYDQFHSHGSVVLFSHIHRT
jgi:FkbM family methyltransferase